MTSCAYFDQADLWGQAPLPYQLQVRADILSLLPSDVSSVLDAGCGDGFIANALPDALQVTGMDFSREALKHVAKPKVLGVVTRLPFADSSFDLVMCNDTLEHLSEEDYLLARRELARVARKYVLITVPNNEQLEKAFARCAACGATYHVNHHRRRHTLLDMEGLLGPAWGLAEARFSGDFTLAPLDPTLEMRRQLGLYLRHTHTFCPACGSREQVGRSEDAPARALLDAVRWWVWDRLAEELTGFRARTELIAVYARVAQASCLPLSCRLEACATTGRGPVEEPGDLLTADFGNPCQAISLGFPTYSRWARYLVPKGASITADGLVRDAGAPDPLLVPVRLPRAPRAGDKFRVKALPRAPGDKVGLYGVGGLSGLEFPLQAEIPLVEGAGEVPAPFAWNPESSGWAVTVYLYGGAVLRSLQLLPGGKAAQPATFLCLGQGHHVVRAGPSLPKVSWGVWSEAAGRVPAPVWTSPEDHAGLGLDAGEAAREQPAAILEAALCLQGMLRRLDQDRQALQRSLNAERQAHQHRLAELSANLDSVNRRANDLRALLDTRSGIRGGLSEVWRCLKTRAQGQPTKIEP